ncbi:MAG: cation diffusion facilitator family transporter [Bacilli bacterium]|nr:cation diffusion facilitator family transporter [Bacilli bacterium]MDD4718467.1 cation diffusion facilitator family transporter [Bacilli bacterium]
MKKENNKTKFLFGRIEKIIIVSFLVNSFLVGVKVIAGVFGTSGALIADGIHSFSDLTTDVIAIVGNSLAKRPADSKHPFGHGKTEYITSLIIGLLIILLGFFLIYEMMNGEITYPSALVIMVSLITIIIKLLLANFLIKKGKKYDNNILIASGKESSTDVFSSIIVLLASIAMQFVDKYQFLKYSDKIASVIVGLFIIKVGFDIVKENISMTIGEQVTNKEYLKNIKDIIINDSEVIEIKDLVILKYGPYLKLDCEVSMKSNLSLLDAHDKIDIIEDRLKKFDNKIIYTTIHMCPYIENK